MGHLTEQASISDFLAGKPGNYIDTLIANTVRFKGWSGSFESKDVIQSTRLALLENFQRGKYISKDLTAYVRQVAEIHCILEMRRHYRFKKHHQEWSESALNIPDPNPGPSNEALVDEKRHQLALLQKGLDKACLKLLFLKFYKSLPYKKIGEVLSMSEVNARVSVFRCLKKSQQILNEKNDASNKRTL